MTNRNVDLVMWAKNGSEFLPRVLKRIEEALPLKGVNNRILVDDHSVDQTTEIAKNFNWTVYGNPSTGISAGANEALRHVESPFFVSFEQDLLLAKNWWRRIWPRLENPKVAVASGMRFTERPEGLRQLQRYVAQKYRGGPRLESWLRSRQAAAFMLGKTLDNTMYKTEIIRALGGFPQMSCNAGLENLLAANIEKAGFRWVVDHNVQSTHLRRGLKHELQHQQFYASKLHEILYRMKDAKARPPITKSGVFFRLAISPITAMFIAFKTREPSIIYIHPLIRFYYARGLLKGG